jgi:hypothetical protein
MNRENIYVALFALVTTLPSTIKESGRRLKHWNDVNEFPAVFQAQKTEVASKSGRGVPTKWLFTCDLYVYVKATGTDLPSTALNAVLDQITTALAAPEPIDNRQTLGGLVEDCWIDGPIQTDEGVLGDIAVAIIPIHILVAA